MRPMIFGEVLFDIFPGGEKVLGGAPFNVAWNLKGLGLDPIFVSRIGKDLLGDEILDRMTRWGMDKQGIQVDPEHPTGRVLIEMSGKNHTFDILPDQAYDFIDLDSVTKITESEKPALVYHGSLIARNNNSKKVINDLGNHFSDSLFIDINLRAPWWQKDEALTLLKKGRWVKLNDDEFEALSGKKINDINIREEAIKFKNDIKCELLIITRGDKGACLIVDNEITREETTRAGFIKDTVGAGDAFSSIMILGLLKKWSFRESIKKANDFAARICTIRGATTFEKEFFKL